MVKVAVLGLGAMGSRMARNILRAGHETHVWNRSPERGADLVADGARMADTPRAAAAGADLVLSCLRDDEASTQVWLDPVSGAVAGLQADAVAIESSTVSLDHVHRLSAAVATRGNRFLDAPVVGSRPQAEAAQLVHLVGGDADAIAAARPCLDAVGARIIHAGAVGHGTALKLAVNTMFATQVAALAEVLAALEKQGVPLTAGAEAFGSLPVCSPAAKAAAQSMAAETFAPLFPADLVEKDLGYALAAMQGHGPVTTAVRDVFRTMRAQGLGADNLTGAIQLYRDTAPRDAKRAIQGARP